MASNLVAAYISFRMQAVANNMAVQGAQNVANSAAMASSAMSGAASMAAAGSVGVVGTVVNGVSNASLGVQLGVVLGVMAVVAGSIASGVVVSSNRYIADVPNIPSLSPTGLGCETPTDRENDNVIIHLKGITRPFNETELLVAQTGFVDVYNELAGGCDAMYNRIMQSADVINQTIFPFDANTTYLDTLWTAEVLCEGCDPADPLFGGQEQGRRHLQAGVSFETFISLFGIFLQDHFPDHDSIFFASTDGMEHVVREATIPDSGTTPEPIDDCGVNPDTESGRVVLYLEGLKRAFNETEQMLVQQTFVDVYNELSDGCKDRYQRFVISANVTNQTPMTVSEDFYYLDTDWAASVECRGCPSNNALFADGVSGRRLQVQLENGTLVFFDEFIAVLNARLTVLPDFVQIALAAVYGDGAENATLIDLIDNFPSLAPSSQPSESTRPSLRPSVSTRPSGSPRPSESLRPSLRPSESSQPSADPTATSEAPSGTPPTISNIFPSSPSPSGAPSVSMSPSTVSLWKSIGKG